MASRSTDLIGHFTVMDGSEGEGDLVCFVKEIVLERY